MSHRFLQKTGTHFSARCSKLMQGLRRLAATESHIFLIADDEMRRGYAQFSFAPLRWPRSARRSGSDAERYLVAWPPDWAGGQTSPLEVVKVNCLLPA